MSEHEKPGDAISLLLTFSRRLYRETRGDSGSPARTLLLRLLLIMFVMPVAAPILWQAALVMPTPLAVFIAVAMVHRFVRWFLRRHQ